MRKFADTRLLRELSSKFCPDLRDVIWHESEVTFSTWGQGLETGKAVEFLALCSLIAVFRQEGHEVKIPKLFRDQPDLFYIRNIIPRHHGAQAGHNAADGESIPLLLRFLGALTPRAIIEQSDGYPLLVFREGHPIHFINYAKKYNILYLERPDLLFSKARIHVESNNESELSFTYEFDSGLTSGRMRVANSPKLPLISLNNFGELDIPICGLVECSVGKGRDRAGDQLAAYKNLCKAHPLPKAVLVNGKNISCREYDIETFIDLNSEGISTIEQSFVDGMTNFSRALLGRSDGH